MHAFGTALRVSESRAVTAGCLQVADTPLALIHSQEVGHTAAVLPGSVCVVDISVTHCILLHSIWLVLNWVSQQTIKDNKSASARPLNGVGHRFNLVTSMFLLPGRLLAALLRLRQHAQVWAACMKLIHVTNLKQCNSFCLRHHCMIHYPCK
jgi:hypothetical protein